MGIGLQAQQIPMYSQYVINNFMLNPAVAGSKKCQDIKLGYRTQWIGFDAAPQTIFISAYGRVKSSNKLIGKSTFEGLGAYAIKDQTGPIGTVGAQFSYAFHMAINQQIFMGMGLSIGALQHSINANLLDPANLPDPAVTSINSLVPDANAGFLLYSSTFFAGFSIRQLVPFKIGGSNNELRQHFLLQGGYKIGLRPGISMIPSIHVKLGMITPIQVDATVKIDWQNKFWVGACYRKVEGMMALAGFHAGSFMHIAYAFDFTLSKIQRHSSNSHEIILGITPFCKNKSKNKYDCPSFQ